MQLLTSTLQTVDLSLCPSSSSITSSSFTKSPTTLTVLRDPRLEAPCRAEFVPLCAHIYHCKCSFYKGPYLLLAQKIVLRIWQSCNLRRTLWGLEHHRLHFLKKKFLSDCSVVRKIPWVERNAIHEAYRRYIPL